MAKLSCEGWWEQAEFGRQPMKHLIIDFSDGQLRGCGEDIVGAFTLTGRLDQDQVIIRKQYVGQHSVEYLGTSEGEGLYRGQWNIGGDVGGEWEIYFKTIADTDQDDISIFRG